MDTAAAPVDELAAAVAPPAAPVTASLARRATLAERLALAAPDADPQVIALALEARQCATLGGAIGDVERLAVIDYSRPSTEPRLWVFDLDDAELLHAEHVAHGKYSGGNMTTRFSNEQDSWMTSLGLFSTAETYVGGNGYSLRMDGLEPGFNDHARERLIVMHGADYVDPEQALRQGRLGRSFGCPAVRDEIAQELIDTLKDGQLLFAYYPDSQWLEGSRFLGCGAVADAGASVASKAGRRVSRLAE
ncbi:murein L,D-transpeptidase catalytic domain family protein [Novilysobacter arseniciresistens]|uniref:murein L,D-transpeptidase catalytic domain family protein n=1 Tax=Novilysobacter arseniciresistens TaxID=1385522 RepID=UPI00068FD8B3|nr:murein L,D-transpeptidase catalytic domain family protein [Lysobacter arseniciresistens]